MTDALHVSLALSGPATAEGGALKSLTLADRPFLIGRSDECDWVVQDEEGAISRRHCELRRHGETLVLVDHSSNGTFVGGPSSRAVRDQPTPLPDTTTLYVGGARIDVEVLRDGRAATLAAEPDDDFFGVRRLEPRKTPTRDDLDLSAAPPEDDGPFFRREPPDDPLSLDDTPGMTPGAAFRPADRGPSPSLSPEPRPAPPEPEGVPDDWLDEAGGGDVPAGRADELDDLEKALGFGDEPGGVPPPQGGGPLDLEPEAGEVGPAPPQTPPQTPPPEPPPTPPPGAEASRRPSSAPRAAADDESLAALFDALGLRVEDIPSERRAEAAAEIGRIFVAMADGLRQILAQRRDVKIALGVTSTQFEMGANPLKWSPDAATAVDGLLQTRSDAYLRGEEAVADAVRTLQSNQLALVGGIKAAIQVALGSFDPNVLEDKLVSKGLAQVVPQLRKAELWDRFVDSYTQFVERANDDIRSVLGRELDRLYDTGPEPPRGAEPHAPPRSGGDKLGL